MRWPELPLTQVARVDRDGIAPEAILAGTSYVGLENVQGNGSFVGVTKVDGGDLASSKFAFTSRHILYGKLRPYLHKIARPDFDGICSTDILPLLPHENIDRDYLAHFLRTESAVSFAESRSVGVNLPRISPTVLGTLMVPVPPLEEQRRIAAILDRAEALRAKRRQALAKLDTLTQLLFRDLYDSHASDRLSISELLDSGHLLLHKDGNHGSQYPRADDFADDGVAFISVKAVTENGEINRGQVDYLTAHKASQLRIGWIEGGDVLLAHNASVGRVGIYRGQFGRALIGTSLTCFRPNPEKLRTGFLAASLNSQFFQRQLLGNMGQTTRNQVPITAQKRLKLSIIPLQAQIAFEESLNRIQSQRLLFEEHQKSIEAIIRSLQHRAFRGEL